MGQIPPGGLGSWPTWLCAAALTSPSPVIKTLTEVYVCSSDPFIGGPHTYVDFTTFPLPAWFTGTLSRAVNAAITAAHPLTITS